MNILLAEDDQELADVIVAVLRAQHYNVVQVSNGQELLDKTNQYVYDVIILDVMMPVMSGIDALKELRQRGDHTYVIMLTALGEIDDKVKGLNTGADDYMTKPFSLKELVARLQSLNRRNHQYDQQVENFGDLKLNNHDQVLESHNSISLTNSETKLLAFLMDNPDKSLSTERLLGQVWDNGDADSQDVWFTISYLRQKLNSIGSKVRIIGEKDGEFRLIKD